MEISFKEYQELSKRTMPNDENGNIVIHDLNGEAGEVAEIIKKGFGHGHIIDRNKIKKS
jgi:hypothetical protein